MEAGGSQVSRVKDGAPIVSKLAQNLLCAVRYWEEEGGVCFECMSSVLMVSNLKGLVPAAGHAHACEDIKQKKSHQEHMSRASLHYSMFQSYNVSCLDPNNAPRRAGDPLPLPNTTRKCYAMVHPSGSLGRPSAPRSNPGGKGPMISDGGDPCSCICAENKR